MIRYRVTNLPEAGTVNFPKFLPKSWQEYVLRDDRLAVRERRITAAVMLLCLCEDIGIAPPPIVYKEGGKPDFADSPYHFNITHAGRLLAVAIADAPIGVDIEPYTVWQEGRYTRLFSAFSVGERERIAKAESPDRAMVEGWVRKESLLKMSGVGLSGFRKVDAATLVPSVEVRVKDYSHLEYYLCIASAAIAS